MSLQHIEIEESPETDDTESMLDFLGDNVALAGEILENNAAFLDILSRIQTNEIVGRTPVQNQSPEPMISHQHNELPLVAQGVVKTEKEKDNGQHADGKDDQLKRDETIEVKLDTWRKDERSHFTRSSFKVLEDALSSSASSSDMSPQIPHVKVTGSKPRKRRYSETRVLEKQIKIESNPDNSNSPNIKIVSVRSLRDVDTIKKSKRSSSRSKTFLKEIEKMKYIMCNLDLSSGSVMDQLSDLMEITYKLRFAELYNKEMPIKDWIGKYPAMTEYKIIKEEFKRSYWTEKDLDKLERKLKEYLPQQVENFRQILHSCANSFAAKCLKKLDSCEKPDKQLVLDTQMACFVHNLTEGKAEGEIFMCNYSGLQPRILVPTPNFEIFQDVDENPSYTIYTEMEKITEVRSFYRAILSTYLFYWIFYLDYSPTAERLFNIFDKLAKV